MSRSRRDLATKRRRARRQRAWEASRPYRAQVNEMIAAFMDFRDASGVPYMEPDDPRPQPTREEFLEAVAQIRKAPLVPWKLAIPREFY